ncbi:hypothetical protein CRI93_06200 [Longimonas halophila]|uniref:DUF2383 domain-containing protein n=1 Tax=Longimonas halophila TaxID=1469170 RepID=A0A2H3NUJ9_9BACT|nr:hypothetical protein [Longimonas halophila]PEN08031.1 hypothetical protein CRI93_06200 [Longimonas halophila]
MPNRLQEALLGRGWAGRTISREETVEHLNPLVEAHIKLNHAYRAVSRVADDPRVEEALESLLKTARADVGKLSETIFSAGGSAYNGTDLEPDDFDLGPDLDTALPNLIEQEEAFQDAVKTERNDVEHQMRTRAILELVRDNSQERLSVIKRIQKRR